MVISQANASPVYEFEFEGVVLADTSEVEYVMTYGDGEPTYISLYGECNYKEQDIDLWVFYGNKLIAKETGNGCEHHIDIITPLDEYAEIKIVVENKKKPLNTGYVLTVY
jgi:hypothetical protein